MKTFDDELLLGDALKHFFSKYHFADGGYHLKWFRIKIGFIYIPLPNIPSRVAVAKIHDIHHVLNEYEATLKGEAEIAGWELASGCGKHIVAWFFNLGSFFYGLFFFPKNVFNAFMSGKQARTNFYLTSFDYHTLLNQKIGTVRASIDISSKRKPSFTDYISFAGYILFTFLLAFIFFYSIYLLVKTLL